MLASKQTAAAAAFQKGWIDRAKELNIHNPLEVDATEGKSERVDGALMEKMTFDAVYSNKHAHKDTESAFGPGFVPIIDLRRDALTRPARCARHQRP